MRPEKGFACVEAYCMFRCICRRWRQVQLQLQPLYRCQGVGVQRVSVSLGLSCKVTGEGKGEGVSGIMLLQGLL